MITSGLQYFYMQSNQSLVDAILDGIEKSCEPEHFSAGLEILTKLIQNIITNPFEAKYRNVKTSNNTIKNKVMSLPKMDQLLSQLGYQLEGDTYSLKDEQVGHFLEGAPAIDYRRRLASARLEGSAAYERELVLVNEHRAQARLRAQRQQESRRLKQKCQYDAMQRKHMKADNSKSNNLNFGTKATTWKDIGVDLCAKKGG